jgi:hypothetical protein
VQVHRRYRFYHLLYLLPLYSNTTITIMPHLHLLANIVMVMVNLIRVPVRGSRHLHYQATIQDLYSHPPQSNNPPQCRFIMNRSHLSHLPSNIPQKMRRHGIKPLSMSILNNNHLRRILPINRLHHIRKIHTMSIQRRSIQHMKGTRIWYMEVQEYQGLVLGIQSPSTIIP